MRDKIVIIGKCAFKTAKRPPVKKSESNRENSGKERSEEFRGTNNAMVAISLESTVGLFWFMNILFFSHFSTNRPEGFEGTQFVSTKSSSTIFWKTKENTPTRLFWSPADFSLFHRWIMPSFEYVVRLDVAFILDGGDWKRNLRQGVVYVKQ